VPDDTRLVGEAEADQQLVDVLSVRPRGPWPFIRPGRGLRTVPGAPIRVDF
jgi:hypothetical protein